MIDEQKGAAPCALDEDPQAMTSMFARIVARSASETDYLHYMHQWDRRAAAHRAARRGAAQ